MISLANGGRLVEPGDELPNWVNAENLYLDFETTSFDSAVPAFDPYQGHRMCGAAVAVDDEEPLYLPLRHTAEHWNYDLNRGLGWLKGVVESAKRNVNHNLKFDAHVARVDGIEYVGEWYDTLTLSKVIDSDRWSHDLKPLCRDWMGMELPEEAELKSYLRRIKSKNYGDVPADLMASYGCMDAEAVRKLRGYIEKKRDPDTNQVWELEKQLTPVLFDMECAGLRPDRDRLIEAQYINLRKLLELSEKLKDMTGKEFVDSSKFIADLLIVQYGLPVLAWGKSKKTGERTGPSFKKQTLLQYKGLAQVATDPFLLDLINTILEWRREDTFRSLFVEPFIMKTDSDGILHPRYNQLVRTGRMSCSDPNSQQFNVRAKELIVPHRTDWAFFSMDASQIEFRLIVDLIEDPAALAAYREDPRTDFHSLVAKLCGIGRKPGKTMNFAMAYGAGKKTTCSTLSRNDEVIDETNVIINEKVASGLVKPEERAREFERMLKTRANEIYHKYHAELPSLRNASNEATEVCKERGYSRNPYGRHRHLPKKFAHNAFNTIAQGWAMDIIKEGMIRAAPRNNRKVREMGIHLCANVHDNVVAAGPTEAINSPEFRDEMIECHSNPSCPIQVPILWDYGTSSVTWKDAG